MITDGSLSVSGLLSSWFQTSLIVDNMLQSAPNMGFYREFIIGTKINIDRMLLLYFDPHWAPSLPSDQSSLGYEAGLEIPVFSDFFIRMGRFESSLFLIKRKEATDTAWV